MAKYFIQKTLPQTQKRLSAEALWKLMEHPWPGNVRELKNVILRSLFLSKGPVIEAGHIEFLRIAPGREALFQMKSVEREKIELALRTTQGNKARAADLLGMARSTIFKKIRNYGIWRVTH
ncbi:MAG: hypothetical protein HYU99_08560 [Deltaproteobacteria bacterium]|nr:hypothetical protein [Deltaproteobacteria bacterium]